MWSYFSGYKTAAGSTRWGQGLHSGEWPPVPSCQCLAKLFHFHPTSARTHRKFVSSYMAWSVLYFQKNGERAEDRERPFICQACSKFQGTMPARTLHFSWEKKMQRRSHFESWFFVCFLKARIEKNELPEVSLNKWKGMWSRVWVNFKGARMMHPQ